MAQAVWYVHIKQAVTTRQPEKNARSASSAGLYHNAGTPNALCSLMGKDHAFWDVWTCKLEGLDCYKEMFLEMMQEP